MPGTEKTPHRPLDDGAFFVTAQEATHSFAELHRSGNHHHGLFQEAPERLQELGTRRTIDHSVIAG
ncbi:hypothetical protein BH23GEM6_BH23GEM6_03180 [soil metagenome]